MANAQFLLEHGPTTGSGTVWRIVRSSFRLLWDGTGVDVHIDDELVVLVLGSVDDVRSGRVGHADASPARAWADVWRVHRSRGLDFVVGPYVVVVHEHRSNHLTVLRDVTGGRPAYLSQAGSTFTAGSDLADVSRHGRQRSPSLPWMAYYLQRELPEAVLTPFDGVDQVIPGHAASPADGAWTQVRRAALRPRRLQPVDLDAAADEVQMLLDQAVERRVRGAAKVGVALSGGIDSTNVLAAVTRVAPATSVVGLAIPFFTPAGDERADQALVANHLDVPLDWVSVAGAGPVRGLGSSVLSGREWPPLAGNWFFQQAVARRADELDVEVVLDGEDADSIFSGSRNYLVDLLARGSWKQWVKAAIALRPLGLGWRWAVGYSLTGLLPPPLERRVLGTPAGWEPEPLLAADLVAASDFRRRLRARPEHSIWAWGRRFAAVQALGAHPDHLAFVGGETSLGSVNLRVRHEHPFLDRDLIETALGLPWWALSPPTSHKLVLRRLARRHLPEGFASRSRKADLSEYFDAAVTGEERDLVLAGLDSAARRVNVFTESVVARLQGAVQSHEPTLEATRAAVLALWLDGLELEATILDTPDG